MHIFIIITSNEGTLEREINTLSKKLKSNSVTFNIKKIEESKEFKKFAVNLPNNTLVHIPSIDDASVETQNSLLKIFEEPKQGLYFVISAKNEASVLPTILSRGSKIQIKYEKETYKGDSSNFFELKIGEKLETLSKIKTREDAVIFLENLLTCAQNSIVSRDYSKAEYARHTIKALHSIKQNGNVSLHLTKLATKLEL